MSMNYENEILHCKCRKGGGKNLLPINSWMCNQPFPSVTKSSSIQDGNKTTFKDAENNEMGRGNKITRSNEDLIPGFLT